MAPNLKAPSSTPISSTRLGSARLASRARKASSLSHTHTQGQRKGGHKLPYALARGKANVGSLHNTQPLRAAATAENEELSSRTRRSGSRRAVGGRLLLRQRKRERIRSHTRSESPKRRTPPAAFGHNTSPACRVHGPRSLSIVCAQTRLAPASPS